MVALVRLGDALSWAGSYHDASAAWRLASGDVPDNEPRMLAERANALIRLGDPRAHDAAYRALVAARVVARREPVPDALNLVAVAEVQAGRLQEALRAAEDALAEVAGEETTAERLVLSVKTVEGHLTTIYGKFGVTSRSQMLAFLARTWMDAPPSSGS